MEKKGLKKWIKSLDFSDIRCYTTPFSTVGRIEKCEKPRRYAVYRTFMFLENVVWKTCSKNFF